MGGRGSSFGVQALASYDSFPVSLRIGGGKLATPQEKKQKAETVTRFLNEAKAGNVYSTGAGIGSAGAQFEVVSFNRSPNKMGLKWSNSNTRPVALSRANIANYIANGARLIKQGK